VSCGLSTAIAIFRIRQLNVSTSLKITFPHVSLVLLSLFARAILATCLPQFYGHGLSTSSCGFTQKSLQLLHITSPKSQCISVSPISVPRCLARFLYKFRQRFTKVSVG
jgi:hypothetical protein